MTDQSAGPDLARQALASWKAAAKTRPATGATKPRKKGKRAEYGDARDPIGLGSVIKQLGAEQEWQTAVDGGTIADRWPEVCPTALRGRVQIDSFDADGQVLVLKPASPTVAQFLRTFGPQLVKQLQEAQLPVRAIKVSGFGNLEARPATPAPKPERVVSSPVAADPSPGYRAALEAHLAASPQRQDTEIQQRIKAAAHAQTEALRAKREDPDGHRDAVWFVNDLEEKAAAEREQARQDAIRRARAEKAGRGPALPTVFQQTA